MLRKDILIDMIPESLLETLTCTSRQVVQIITCKLSECHCISRRQSLVCYIIGNSHDLSCSRFAIIHRKDTVKERLRIQ